MEPGDIVSDTRQAQGQAHSWTVSQLLGQGLWSRSWVVRDESGREAVLKVPLTADDVVAPADLLDACRQIGREQADLFARRRYSFLPELIDQVVLSDGSVGLLLPRYASSVAERMAAGMPVVEAVHISAAIAELLADNPDFHHGNIRPTNVFRDDNGLVLTDPATPTWLRYGEALTQLTARRDRWQPPEATQQETALPGWDTWALCAALWTAAMSGPSVDARPRAAVVPPSGGLDKLELVELKDRVTARLKAEHANPRFSSRVVERLGATLNRGLCTPTTPSPPYRFHSAADLAPRLREIADLFDPSVKSVSRIMLAQTAENDVFQGGNQVAFSATVGTTAGITAHDDIVAGVNLTDLDADGDGRVAVEDCRFTVKQYPSGRWRFHFVLPDIAPGRYKVKVAFTIKDARRHPQIAEGQFEVRPPPGYVPPAEPDAQPTPIELHSKAVSPAPTPVRSMLHRVPPLQAVPSSPGPPTATIESEGFDDLSSAGQSSVGSSAYPLPIAPSRASSPGVSSKGPQDPGFMEDDRDAPTNPLPVQPPRVQSAHLAVASPSPALSAMKAPPKATVAVQVADTQSPTRPERVGAAVGASPAADDNPTRALPNGSMEANEGWQGASWSELPGPMATMQGGEELPLIDDQDEYPRRFGSDWLDRARIAASDANLMAGTMAFVASAITVAAFLLLVYSC